MDEREVSFVKTTINKDRAQELVERLASMRPGEVLFCDSQEEMDFLDELLRKGREQLIVAGVGLGPRRTI